MAVVSQFQLMSFLIQYLAFFNLCSLTTAGVVYYVKPIEPCAHNGSCPPGEEICHTMDHYASKSSHYFSPDQIDATLYFLCGVHNCTQHMNIYDLQTLTMIGTAEKKFVMINMPITMPEITKFLSSSRVHMYTFTNVSNLVMKELSIHNISLSFEGKGCKFSAQNVDFYGYGSLSLFVPVISVSNSQAVLDNCSFVYNTFLLLNSNAKLTINDCIFLSYNYTMQSAIVGENSMLTLSGTVKFTNNSFGSPSCSSTAISLSHNKDFTESTVSLNITSGAFVHFHNNTGTSQGGALLLTKTAMNIGTGAIVMFNGNKAKSWGTSTHDGGGAIMLINSSIYIGRNATLYLMSNSAFLGGALYMLKSCNLHLEKDTLVYFTGNTAQVTGGAIYMWESNIELYKNAKMYFIKNIAEKNGGAIGIEDSSSFVAKYAVVHFINNSAKNGAIFMLSSTFVITKHSEVQFINNKASLCGGAIYQAPNSDVTVSQSTLIFSNNSAYQGGAFYVTSPAKLEIGSGSFVLFTDNFVSNTGGAIYASVPPILPCFLVLTSYSSALKFQGNSAESGTGMHIYGASIRSDQCVQLHKKIPYCGKDNINISYIPSINNSFSPVSSEPKRVCLCDLSGFPQCASLSNIFVNEFSVYSGESITLSLVVVGHDFGATPGTVHANFMYYKFPTTHSASHLHPDQYHQWVPNNQCSSIHYTIYSIKNYETLYLRATTVPVNHVASKIHMNTLVSRYNLNQNGCLSPGLLNTPVFIKIKVLPGCPPGLTLSSNGDGCNCYPILKSNQFTCYVKNNTGFLEWNSTMWVNMNKDENNSILFSKYCPSDHCEHKDKTIDIADDPDAQCAFNHAGILCGSCKKNYTLAIGSYRCIRCSSDGYLTLFTVFAAAGVLLAIFILLLDLTVTRGLINGLIFYANVVWTYKGILFPQSVTQVLQIFIAWLNLDFGIETCLVVGLSALQKMWLQFLFPLYIWFIAGVIIIACRYSHRLTNIIGDRAVPLLATLFLLSYTKLLRNIVAIFEFGVLTSYPDMTTTVVWYLDGNMPYCRHPHIYLFLIAMATLMFCLFFTIFILLLQCWRRISHLRLLRWINKFTPFYDAYLAPLKDKHHYWFGTLLVTRVVLLITFTATSSTTPITSLLVLLLSSAVLLFYMSSRPVYLSAS